MVLLCVIFKCVWHLRAPFWVLAYMRCLCSTENNPVQRLKFRKRLLTISKINIMRLKRKGPLNKTFPRINITMEKKSKINWQVKTTLLKSENKALLKADIEIASFHIYSFSFVLFFNAVSEWLFYSTRKARWCYCVLEFLTCSCSFFLSFCCKLFFAIVIWYMYLARKVITDEVRNTPPTDFVKVYFPTS